MLFVCALLCIGVVCQVSLVRVFMRVCVPYLSTRSEEEVMLQQVRDLLPPFRLSPVSRPTRVESPLFGSCLNSDRFGGQRLRLREGQL